jgi:hypothetical protein
MAEHSFTTNRREFLFAGAIAATAVVMPIEASARPSEWDAAMARWLNAKAEEERFLDTVKVMRDTPLSVDEALLQLQLATDLCEADLMQTPAPTPEALRWKVERLIEVERNCSTQWPAAYVPQTKADLANILGVM